MELNEILAKLQDTLNERLKTEGSLPFTYVISAEPGKVYTRIVRGEIWTANNGGNTEEVNRSVYGFIKNDDLTLWKAAGWKAPAKNKARGVLADLADPAKVLPKWRYSIG